MQQCSKPHRNILPLELHLEGTAWVSSVLGFGSSSAPDGWWMIDGAWSLFYGWCSQLYRLEDCVPTVDCVPCPDYPWCNLQLSVVMLSDPMGQSRALVICHWREDMVPGGWRCPCGNWWNVTGGSRSCCHWTRRIERHGDQAFD